MQQSIHRLFIVLVRFLVLLPLISAQSPPDCAYPCLPPPISGGSGGGANYPPPPPFASSGYPPPASSGGGFNYPPPAGFLPSPQFPSFGLAPPPPDTITPWFPYYRRSSAGRSGVGFVGVVAGLAVSASCLLSL